MTSSIDNDDQNQGQIGGKINNGHLLPKLNPWQVKVLNFLHSKSVGSILFILLICDILIMFINLFLEGFYPHCSYVIRDAVCTVNDDGGGDDDNNNNIIATATCDGEKYPYVEFTKEMLEKISFGILLVFAAENCILLGILGRRDFFHHIMYLFDFIVVFVSLGFETASLFFLNEDKLFDDLIQFIIIGRLWRFVSLSYDLLVIEKEHEDEIIESLEEKITDLEQKLLLVQQTNNDDNNDAVLKIKMTQQHHDNNNNSADSTDYHKLT